MKKTETENFSDKTFKTEKKQVSKTKSDYRLEKEMGTIKLSWKNIIARCPYAMQFHWHRYLVRMHGKLLQLKSIKNVIQ